MMRAESPREASRGALAVGVRVGDAPRDPTWSVKTRVVKSYAIEVPAGAQRDAHVSDGTPHPTCQRADTLAEPTTTAAPKRQKVSRIRPITRWDRRITAVAHG